MDKVSIIAVVIAAIAISGTCYFIFYRKKSSTPATSIAAAGWVFQYSPNMPAQMATNADGYFFDFPTVDGVHYVVKGVQGVVLGQTITMNFNISGNGTLAVADPADTIPATIRLHLQGSAGVNDRWFQHTGTNLTQGDHTVSLQLIADNFGGVGGGISQPTDFPTAVRNLVNAGFTFGGQSFAGHGVYVKDGNARFTLKSFTIQ